MNRQTLVCSTVLFFSLSSVFAGGPSNLPNSQDPEVSPSSSTSPKQLGSTYSRSPKPPFPFYLRSQINATRDMQYNAVIKIVVKHGRVVDTVPVEVTLTYRTI
jgi:hypothetical protein